MIRASYGVKDGIYTELTVTGHALSADPGKDLICASVSSIMFGLLNALDELDEDVKTKQSNNRISVRNFSSSPVVKDYLELALFQLKTIEESYGDFIKVERKETI